MKKRERRAEDERRIWEMVVRRRGGTVGSRVRRKDLTPFASIVPHCAETNNYSHRRWPAYRLRRLSQGFGSLGRRKCKNTSSFPFPTIAVGAYRSMVLFDDVLPLPLPKPNSSYCRRIPAQTPFFGYQPPASLMEPLQRSSHLR